VDVGTGYFTKRLADAWLQSTLHAFGYPFAFAVSGNHGGPRADLRDRLAGPRGDHLAA